jgi:NitT/TauT family transport system substrate-binding protein
MMSRKLFCTLLVTAGAALANPAWAADKVRVGAFQSVSDAALYIALEKGYFAEQRIEVEMTKINSGATMVTELASESLDVSGGSPGAGVYNAVRQGVPMKIVADKGSTHPGRGYFAIVVRKDLAGEIRTPADFKGRVLAVTGYQRGASSEVTIGKVLEEAGLKESDVKLMNMAFGDIVAALGTKRVEIGVLIEPLVTLAVQKDVATIWKRTDEIYPSQQYGALMYGPGIIKRPEVASRFMVAYIKGVRFYNDALSGKTPSKELVDILTKHTSVKNRALYDKMAFPGLHPDGKLNIEGMRQDVSWWAEHGRMKEAVDVSRVVDMSYAEHAVKQLGAYR